MAELEQGELQVIGRLVDASNATLFARIGEGPDSIACVYKPIDGERPLHDFPTGHPQASLAAREVASYQLSAALGLAIVPETVFRDGPFGRGSVQRWVGPAPDQESPEPETEAETEPAETLVDLFAAGQEPEGWRPVLSAYGPRGEELVLAHADDPRLRTVALLDLLLNNADRKGSHLLIDDGQVYGVDHGLTFHQLPKLRTVLWGWAGESLSEAELKLLNVAGDALSGDLASGLSELLAPPEVEALQTRLSTLLTEGVWPTPDAEAPMIPWPPL